MSQVLIIKQEVVDELRRNKFVFGMNSFVLGPNFEHLMMTWWFKGNNIIKVASLGDFVQTVTSRDSEIIVEDVMSSQKFSNKFNMILEASCEELPELDDIFQEVLINSQDEQATYKSMYSSMSSAFRQLLSDKFAQVGMFSAENSSVSAGSLVLYNGSPYVITGVVQQYVAIKCLFNDHDLTVQQQQVIALPDDFGKNDLHDFVSGMAPLIAFNHVQENLRKTGLDLPRENFNEIVLNNQSESILVSIDQHNEMYFYYPGTDVGVCIDLDGFECTARLCKGHEFSRDLRSTTVDKFITAEKYLLFEYSLVRSLLENCSALLKKDDIVFRYLVTLYKALETMKNVAKPTFF